MTLSDLERWDARGHIFQPNLLNSNRLMWQQNTCWGAHFYGVRHTTLQGGQCPSAVQFWSSLIFLHTSFATEQPNLMWEGLIFMGSALSQWGWVPSAPQFWEFPYMYGYTLSCRTTKFEAATHMGSGHVVRRSITVQPQSGGAPALPNFAGFPSMTTL